MSSDLEKLFSPPLSLLKEYFQKKNHISKDQISLFFLNLKLQSTLKLLHLPLSFTNCDPVSPKYMHIKMPQKLIIRKADLPIVNFPVKCCHPCGSIENAGGTKKTKNPKTHQQRSFSWLRLYMVSVQEAAGLRLQLLTHRPKKYTHNTNKRQRFNFIP